MELFETTGQVELAEILFEGTRSKGCGVVQFAVVAEAETAIGKLNAFFQTSINLPVLQPNSKLTCMVDDLWVRFPRSAYSISCLNSLDVRFNDRWHTFTPSSAKGGQAMQADA